ncbi:MAG: glycosyl transferase [Betaproteobacteria bacterium]|nr:glycosyl transferase [Betaproteobacteria bacterium]
MEHYVTLFDGNFLPQGLALLESLERHAGEHTLWVLCLDDRAREVLDGLAKPNLRTIPLAEVETPELLAVKPGRNRMEYCWTLTPFTPQFVFQRESLVERVTYLDADLFLLKSPRQIFEEFDESRKSVLITEHAYDAEYDQSATSGRFCVQFMTFVRNESEPVRSWWVERCLEWCFDQKKDGRFGDQKYLDDWPERFPNHVHVLRQEAAILAPWNARRFPYSKAIAWHFQALRIHGDRIRWYLGDEIPEVVEAQVYLPYVKLLEQKLQQLGQPVVQGRLESTGLALMNWGKLLIKRILGLSRKLRRQKISYIRID